MLPLDLTWGVGETPAPGENEEDVGSAVGVDPVQAESAPEASMVMVPQPTRASFALSPVFANAIRTFMEPAHSPVPESAGKLARNGRSRHKHALT